MNNSTVTDGWELPKLLQRCWLELGSIATSRSQGWREARGI